MSQGSISRFSPSGVPTVAPETPSPPAPLYQSDYRAIFADMRRDKDLARGGMLAALVAKWQAKKTAGSEIALNALTGRRVDSESDLARKLFGAQAEEAAHLVFLAECQARLDESRARSAQANLIRARAEAETHAVRNGRFLFGFDGGRNASGTARMTEAQAEAKIEEEGGETAMRIAELYRIYGGTERFNEELGQIATSLFQRYPAEVAEEIGRRVHDLVWGAKG